MSKLVGRFVYGYEEQAAELVRDLSADGQLVASPGGIYRLAGGRGWRIWHAADGSVCVTEHSPAECDDVAAAVAQDAEELRATEEQLRELSRESRNLGLETIAPRSSR